MPARPVCTARATHGFSGRPRPTRPATMRRGARAHTGVVTALWARVAARPMAALQWQRWSKRRRSSTHGGGDSSPELLVDGEGGETRSTTTFSDEARALVAGGGPASGWRERELGSTFHRRKSGKRGLVLPSPWKSSRRRRRPDSDGGTLGQRRSASDTDDGAVGTGAREARRRRGTDSGEAQSERLSGHRRGVSTAPLRHASGAGAWQPRSDGALTGGPSVESGGWPPHVSDFHIKITPGRK
jgi:hypothetical protein